MNGVFEILAFHNVRMWMGPETPFPPHPLLLEVLAAVRKVLPDV